MSTSLPLEILVEEDNNHNRYWPRKHRRYFCYTLHALLVTFHVVLLVISVSNHKEHHITISSDSDIFTTGLSIGLQSFYTIYTALLVFVTQRLVLSATFSGSKKLTHIHNLCGAWGGLGAALGTLWSQTKVNSSILSIGLVTLYFSCVAVLYVASSTIMQFQPFNGTVTQMVPAVATWPSSSVNLSSLDWTATTILVPFLQILYADTTRGLVNNTLYDVPMQSFVSATVDATTLNTHCGLLTNLPVNMTDWEWSIDVFMTNVGPFEIDLPMSPLPNEIWFISSPLIDCSKSWQECTNMILFLVSATMNIDDSVHGTNHVYFNGTYSPPGASQFFATPAYFVMCFLDATTNQVTISSSGDQLKMATANEQPSNVTWSTFLPGGNMDLTNGISHAMESDGSLIWSPYCQPSTSPFVPFLPQDFLFMNITVLNVYMVSMLGMGQFFCDWTSLLHYTTSPFLLSRSHLENVVSQIATELIWLAGELGSAGGGFDRQMKHSQTTEYMLQWRLNINTLPVLVALCASVMLFVLVVNMLWGEKNYSGVVSTAGVLEIMWLGSYSHTLHGHFRDIQDLSVDSLCASSMFQTTLCTCSTQVCVNKRSNCLSAAIPLDDEANHAINFQSVGSLKSASRYFHLPSGLYYHRPHHTTHASRGHWCCYILHTVLVALHIVLLTFLVWHPEHSIVIPLESNVMTIGLSALLQAIYTLYSTFLVIVMQRLALFRIVCERRKLTAVHDVSGAWTGIGAAVYILWQQFHIPSSIWAVTVVVTYLSSMLVLHIGSSSIMQWQAFNSTLVEFYPSNLALPGSAVDLSQLMWSQISPIARMITQYKDVPTYGLTNCTLYDLPEVPANVNLSTALVNATTIDAECRLVPNITLSPPSPAELESGDPSSMIQFSLGGWMMASFLYLQYDLVFPVIPVCSTCLQALFYVITTRVDVDASVRDPVAVKVNWTYTPSGGNPKISETLTYLVVCSVGARTVPATLNLQKRQLSPTTDQVASSTNISWTVWSPGGTTDFSAAMATALVMDPTSLYYTGDQQNADSLANTMESYIMSLVGLNLTSAVAASGSHSSANPTVLLAPSQLENAIALTAARFLWVAGQVGESGGGFQRTVGESQVNRGMLQWRLNLNFIPVLFVSIASFTALALVPFVIGKRPPKGYSPMISGTSVLESLWLEAQSEVIHSCLQVIQEPCLDALRTAGMFEVTLGDVGRSGRALEAQRSTRA